MTVSIIVPYEPGGCEHRARAWDYVRTHYETHHPDWQIVTGGCSGEWSKGAAVAGALTRATGDILVLADADSFVSPEALNGALRGLSEHSWAIPHRYVLRLNDQATVDVLAGGKPDRRRLARTMYKGVLGGGIVVVARAAYERAPIDARFQNWGAEDISFGFAMETLFGPPLRLRADLWHLWHPHPAPSLKPSSESRELLARYRAAARKPEQMEGLCRELR